MFNSDIERKIIEFVKKSPIGTTSNEIAKFLGLNRMTISRYLNIIQEKALLDFKQLGMTKLYFIPVEINRESFLVRILSGLLEDLDQQQGKKSLIKISTELGKEIEHMYHEFNKVEHMNYYQLSDAFEDLIKKIGGKVDVEEKNEKKLCFRLTSSPFEEEGKQIGSLMTVLTQILGVMVAKNAKYAKVCVQKPDNDQAKPLIVAYLKKSKESAEAKGKEFSV